MKRRDDDKDRGAVATLAILIVMLSALVLKGCKEEPKVPVPTATSAECEAALERGAMSLPPGCNVFRWDQPRK